MKCIIVEDEPLARDRLKNYIGKVPDLELLYATDNGHDALVFLERSSPDIIFLDINMPGISGIDLLEKYDINAAVIITTAYDDFAVKGFELNVTDYLLKPFSFERFLQAIEKARHQMQKPDSAKELTSFFVKTEYRLEKIFIRDLFYIEGMRDYRKLHTRSKPIMTLQTFRDFEKEIPATILCRIHKSYMVVVDNIDAIEKNEIRINDKMIPVSETYKERFFQIMRTRQ